MATLVDQFRTLLAGAYEKYKDDPWQYARVVGTAFVDFVGFNEKAFRALSQRCKAIEEKQAKFEDALAAAGVVISAPESAPGNGHVETPAPVAQSVPRSQAAGPPRGLVRLDALGQPMSAEDQAAEEAADLQFNGEIDQSRYAPPGTRITAATQPPVEQPPAPVPAPHPTAPAPAPQAQKS